MEKVMPKFSLGAKVFAKMKGYPAWPASIDGIEDLQSNKFKYNVFFYGTHQVGICKEEELKPYVEYRKKLGKAKHYKGFNEALEQMDIELGLVLSNTDAADTTDSEYDRLQGVKKRGRGRPRSKSKSRSVSCSGSPQFQTRYRTTSVSRSRSPQPLTRYRTRSVSRSRSPQPLTRYRTRSVSRSRSPRPLTRSVSRSRSRSRSKSPSDPSNQPRQRSRSGSFSKPETSCQLSIIRSSSLDRKREPFVKQNLKAKQCIINPSTASARGQKQALSFLKNESTLNDAIFGLQTSLSLDRADVESAMKHLDECLILDLNPLVLKKHPEAVDTFEKLQIYCGNVGHWKMSREEMKIFLHKVQIIQTKAKLIHDRISRVFVIPKGKQFSQVFKEEVEKFKSAIEGIPMETVWKMTKDPTLV